MNKYRLASIIFQWTVAFVTITMVFITTGLSTQYSQDFGTTSVIKNLDELKSSYHNRNTDTSAQSKKSQSNINYDKIRSNSRTGFQASSPNQDNRDATDNLLLDSGTFLQVKERFDERMAHIISLCRQPNYYAIPSLQIWNKFAFGRLQYCPIPKCGTTFVGRDLTATLRKLDTKYEIKSSYPRDKPKRFFIVREPYSRLVSAFFSKIVGHPFWWSSAGHLIVKKFRLNASNKSIDCGSDITFSEYIKFVIDIHKGGEGRDPHFIRMMEVCNVCVDIPDFVVKLETIRDDMKYILQSVDVIGDTGLNFIEVKNLAKVFVKAKNKYVKNDCGPMCSILQRYWYGQQATGLISEDIDLPLKGQECDNITGEKLARLAMDAHRQTVGRIDKHKYKEKVMTQLFRQVPMADRKELQKLLLLECELFGYDPQPAYVFPKLF